VGRNITKGVLERTSFKEDSVLSFGRTVYSMGKGCLCAILKALACLSNLPEVESMYSEGITYQSGVTECEVKEQLLEKMYFILEGKLSLEDELEDCNEDVLDNNKPAEDDDIVLEEDESDKRPSTWFSMADCI
jgi:hypothetical protein